MPVDPTAGDSPALTEEQCSHGPAAEPVVAAETDSHAPTDAEGSAPLPPPAAPVIDVANLDWDRVAKSVAPGAVGARMRGTVEELETLLDSESGLRLLFDDQDFCTNHDEGIWLDGPVCSRCGAKFGDPLRKSAPAPMPVPGRPATAPDFRPPTRRRTAERPPKPDFGPGPPRLPGPDAPADPEILRRTASLGELLEELSEARARRGAPYEVDERPSAAPPRRGIGFPLAGCLVRILGLGFLLFLALIVFLFLLFGNLIGR